MTDTTFSVGDLVEVRDCPAFARFGLPNPNPGVLVECSLGRPDEGLCVAFDDDPGDPKTPVHFGTDDRNFPMSCVERRGNGA